MALSSEEGGGCSSVSPREGFLEEEADLNVWRAEESTVGRETRVSKGMEVPKCGMGVQDHEPSLHVGAEWEMRQEGKAGAGWVRKALECQAKEEELDLQTMGSH